MNLEKCQSRSLIALLIIVTAMMMGCGAKEIKSKWLHHPSMIGDAYNDPKQDDGRLFIADGETVIEIFNDEKSLLLRLSTRNHGIHRQLSTAGLTVWFDEAGGKKKRYGLQFPPSGSSQEGQEPPQGYRHHPEEEMEKEDSPARHNRINTGDIKITGPGDPEHGRISVTDSKPYGIHLRTDRVGDYFLYELHVPLIRNAATPYGIALHTTKVIGVGLKSQSLEKPQAETGISSGGGGGRRGGGRQGGGDTAGSLEEGRPDEKGLQEKTKPIDLWLKVHLAAKR